MTPHCPKRLPGRIVLLLASLASLSAGCGGSSEAPSNTTSEPGSAPEAAAAPRSQPAPAAASSTGQRSRSEPASGPRLVFDETYVDFGEIDDTRPVQCEFFFRNDGTEVLEIARMKASCGCTTPELDRKVFEPGDGDSIRVDWDPRGLGLQSQSVTVFVKHEARPTILTVRARVTPRVRAVPNVIDFGTVQQNESKTVSIDLFGNPDGVKILRVTPKVAGSVTAVFVPGTGDGETTPFGQLEVKLLPRDRRGAFASAVLLTNLVVPEDKSDPYEYEFEVSLRASVHGVVVAEPDAFYVGRVAPKDTVDYPLRLRRPDGAAFQLEHAKLVQCNVPSLRLETQSGSDERGHFVELFIRGSVEDSMGLLRGSVNVLTDVPGDEELTLGVMGMIRD